MQNLFYSDKERIIFWVYGYAAVDNVLGVWQMIECLKIDADKFAKELEIPFEDVKTLVVNDSSRYKNMRVYYAVNKDCPKPSTLRFQLGGNWTMNKWLFQ